MTRLRLLMVICAALAAGSARAQMARPGMNFAGAIGLNVPIGDLDKVAETGFGVAIRTSFGDPAAVWGFRNSFTFDRFGGKRASGVDNYQYLGLFGWDVVHHTNKQVYQYVGGGFYQFKQSFPAASPTIGGGGTTRSESDFGFQGGVGLNFGRATRTFLEIGFVDVLTSGKSSVWFPLRFGIRL